MTAYGAPPFSPHAGVIAPFRPGFGCRRPRGRPRNSQFKRAARCIPRYGAGHVPGGRPGISPAGTTGPAPPPGYCRPPSSGRPPNRPRPQRAARSGRPTAIHHRHGLGGRWPDDIRGRHLPVFGDGNNRRTARAALAGQPPLPGAGTLQTAGPPPWGCRGCGASAFRIGRLQPGPARGPGCRRPDGGPIPRGCRVP